MRALVLLALLLLARPAAPAPLAEEEELSLRRQEAALLHARLDLSGLRELHDIPGQIPPRPGGKVPLLRLVHLWAVSCHTCVREFEVLRRITQSYHGQPDLEIALVAEDEEDATLRSFLVRQKDRLPPARHYQSLGDGVRGSLQNRTQPATLLVDPAGVVRQAFLGSLEERRNELADAIARLLASLGPSGGPVSASGARDLGAGPVLPPAQGRELRHRRTESFLLHLRIDLGAARLPQQRRRGAGPTPLRLVHVVSGSADETGDLLLLGRSQRSYRQGVAFLYVLDAPLSGNQDGAGLRRQVPGLMLYHVPTLRGALQYPERPVTLLIDEQDVVRQVVVGPLVRDGDRRNELADGVERARLACKGTLSGPR